MEKIWMILLLLLAVFSCSNPKEKAEDNQEITPALNENNPVVKKDINEAAQKTEIIGIDVSHFQGDIDWEKIKKAGISFVYDKATQGTGFTDPEYHKNKIGAENSGIAHGAYHFYISDADPKAQALHFISTIDHQPGNLPPVLDLEQGGIKENLDIPKFQEAVFTWLKLVEDSLGQKPIIYTNHPFGDQYLNHTGFSDHPLWIAEYGVNTPKIPEPWKEKGWLIWQRSDRGKVEGAVGDVDHDLFNPNKSFDDLQ